MKKDISVTDVEIGFDVADLFFSTTDRKGIITSCNDVFTRVAEYHPSEALGKPHNLVRHPDMPRCVFALLWDYLLSGRSIGAYVKNRSKSGKYYWVFALASPIDGGFLSIRLKPTSPVLDIVKGLYGQLLSREESFGQDWRAGMEAAKGDLLKALNGLGFSSYDEFMAEALRAELASRYVQLAQRGDKANSPLQEAFGDLQGLQDLKSNLRNKNQFFLSFGTSLSRSSLNLGIKAAHLADQGRALGVICSEISSISGQVRIEAAKAAKENDRLTRELEASCFDISLAALLFEMLTYFSRERERLKLSEAEQLERLGNTFTNLQLLLESCLTARVEKACASKGQLSTVLGSFESSVEALTKILLSVQFSFVTGRSLSATIPGSESFAALLSDIIGTADQARKEIEAIYQQVSGLHGKVRNWELRASNTNSASQNRYSEARV
ncbi:MAG: PAS domain-containing protein [Oligoflexia bacterium]|nr:PAS domain-containing protein [Oligoflexia bacterium]